MSDINSEWVEKAAQALNDMRSRRSWAFHEIGQPLGDTVYDDERRADARAALEAVADDLRAEGAAEVLEKVAKLHSPIAIYDECECEDKSTPDHVTDHAMDHDVGPSCNHVYDACRECCGLTDGAGHWWMHERCSLHLYGHRHRPGKPICATRATIESALGES